MDLVESVVVMSMSADRLTHIFSYGWLISIYDREWLSWNGPWPWGSHSSRAGHAHHYMFAFWGAKDGPSSTIPNPASVTTKQMPHTTVADAATTPTPLRWTLGKTNRFDRRKTPMTTRSRQISDSWKRSEFAAWPVEDRRRGDGQESTTSSHKSFRPTLTGRNIAFGYILKMLFVLKYVYFIHEFFFYVEPKQNHYSRKQTFVNSEGWISEKLLSHWAVTRIL